MKGMRGKKLNKMLLYSGRSRLQVRGQANKEIRVCNNVEYALKDFLNKSFYVPERDIMHFTDSP